MNTVWSRVGQRVPVGTNRGLFHGFWVGLRGRPPPRPRAAPPGWAALGGAAEAVRRAWAAWAYGQWPTAQWLEAWEQLVQEGQGLHAHQYGGYRPGARDRVPCLRPR